MREVVPGTAFKKDVKKLNRSSQADMRLLEEVVALLANDLPLPERNRDHSLSGDWDGFRECHVKPDLLLIYRLAPGELILARAGSHAALFG